MMCAFGFIVADRLALIVSFRRSAALNSDCFFEPRTPAVNVKSRIVRHSARDVPPTIFVPSSGIVHQDSFYEVLLKCVTLSHCYSLPDTVPERIRLVGLNTATGMH